MTEPAALRQAQDTAVLYEGATAICMFCRRVIGVERQRFFAPHVVVPDKCAAPNPECPGTGQRPDVIYRWWRTGKRPPIQTGVLR